MTVQGGRVTVTVAGSSNFGHRSFFRDFESQVCIAFARVIWGVPLPSDAHPIVVAPVLTGVCVHDA